MVSLVLKPFFPNRKWTFTKKGATRLIDWHNSQIKRNEGVLQHLDIALRGPLGEGKSSPIPEAYGELEKGGKGIKRKATPVVGVAAGALGALGYTAKKFFFDGTMDHSILSPGYLKASSLAAAIGAAAFYYVRSRSESKLREKNAGTYAEYSLKRRKNESFEEHFGRIRLYMDTLRKANKIHQKYVDALSLRLKRKPAKRQ